MARFTPKDKHMLRKLRIAFSVVCGTVCLLLILSAVVSYRTYHNVWLRLGTNKQVYCEFLFGLSTFGISTIDAQNERFLSLSSGSVRNSWPPLDKNEIKNQAFKFGR